MDKKYALGMLLGLVACEGTQDALILTEGYDASLRPDSLRGFRGTCVVFTSSATDSDRSGER